MSWIISHAISAVKSETPQHGNTRAADFGQVGDAEGEGTVGRINDARKQGSAQLNIL